MTVKLMKFKRPFVRIHGENIIDTFLYISTFQFYYVFDISEMTE